jgi:hypothetical protein
LIFRYSLANFVSLQIKKEIYIWQIEDIEADLNEAKERIGKLMPDIAVDWIWLCPTQKLRLES